MNSISTSVPLSAPSPDSMSTWATLITPSPNSAATSRPSVATARPTSASRSLGFIDLKYSLDYAFGGGGAAPSGWFHQLGAEKAFSLTDDISLVLGAGIAYSDGYWDGSGWNHYYATASLPISLNCRTTLTPYIGYIGGPDTWIVDGIFGGIEPQSDILHGGVALSVSF